MSYFQYTIHSGDLAINKPRKYQKGDIVRCINEKQPVTIKNWYRDEWFHYYDIQYHENRIVARVPENGLVPFNKE